jgi:hypothetical protein
MNGMPVWFVEKDGNLVGIIQLDEPDTWNYRREAKNYSDCNVWVRNMLGWCVMNTNYAFSDIWKPAKAPDTIKLAHMLRGE